MTRLTLAAITNSRLPSLIGECANNLNVLRSLVNEAQERLLTDPRAPDDGWWGGWATMAFNVTVENGQGYIVCPRDVARLVAITVCSQPVKLRNGFYEYLDFGAGLRTPQDCCSAKCNGIEAFDRDCVSTIGTLEGNRRIDVYLSDDADIGRKVVIQGIDANGNQITELDLTTMRAISGETVYLTSPMVSTVNTFSVITGILKQATIGKVRFDQVDPASLESSYLTTMDPGETTAYYRRLLLSGLPSGCYGGTSGLIQVSAQAKLDLVPAQSLQDYLLISSLPALIEEMQSIRYGSLESDDASAKEDRHHGKAMQLLFGQLDHYLGKTRPAIEVPIFGSAKLKRQPR